MALKLVAVVFVLIASINSVYSDCTPTEQTLCKLPYCRCPSLEIPNGLAAANTPQIVSLSFDDAVSVINYRFYEDLIFPLKNPNGAPISASFYVTHEYTNYSMVHDLYTKGHEIALHSFTHAQPTTYWRDLNRTGWELEVADQRGSLAHFANIPKSAIKGFRAPYLQPGGDTMVEVLYDEGVEYDISRPTYSYMDPALWPYTADYDQGFQDCQIAPCSTKPYPGFWIVPMVDYISDDGYPCAMVDTCLPVPETSVATFNLLKRNFERHYNGNRAPFGVYIHSAWFTGEEAGPLARIEGYRQFLAYLQEKSDVYIVSVAKALDWVRNPTALDSITSFAPWQWAGDLPRSCTHYNCHFPAEDTPFPSERYMAGCQSCPRKYPWLGNPYGLNP